MNVTVKVLILIVAHLYVEESLALQRDSRPRIIVSTDIGGDDPDDYQSTVHLLTYADRFHIEGLISSPPGKGRKLNIDEVIKAYEKDYPKLRKHVKSFPRPSYLSSVTKQGAIEVLKGKIPDGLSEGASWIIKKAKEKSDKPVYILVWGSITDVAQAVHADPSIKKSIRIYSIGSWNTRQDENSRDYLFNQHPDLWWIENNTTFRGMYMGGFVDADFSNTSFVETHIKPAGALGDLFWQKKRDIKMGDTPSVLYFLFGDINNPEGESWGGSFMRANGRLTYWTDKPDADLIENERPGARTVNTFRKLFLNDWATRLHWLFPIEK